jgi:hypothetical protein
MQGRNRISFILSQIHAKNISLFSSFSSIQNHFHFLLSCSSYIQIIVITLHHIIFIQELQTIKLKQDNNNYINHVEFMSYYAMTVTNKRYSYPRVTTINTLQGKTRPTRHTFFTLDPHMALDHTYLTWSTYINLSWVANRFGRIPLLWIKGLPTQSTAHRLTNPRVHTQSFSQAN